MFRLFSEKFQPIGFYHVLVTLGLLPDRRVENTCRLVRRGDNCEPMSGTRLDAPEVEAQRRPRQPQGVGTEAEHLSEGTLPLGYSAEDEPTPGDAAFNTGLHHLQNFWVLTAKS